MAYFSDVRQLLRNRRFDIVSQNSNEDGRKHTHTRTHTQAFIPVSMTLHRYRFILLGGERHCGSKVFHLRTYHIDPARS